MKLKRISAMILATSLLLTGCSKPAEDTGAGDHTTSGKEIAIGVTSFADTLEPTEQYFSWVISRYGVGEGLTKFDPQGEIVPSLAEEWGISDDNLTWTFKIREDVKFSNGDLMTPELVKASLDRTFEMAPRAATFFEPESITVDGQNLLIKTKTPSAIVPGALADPLFLIIHTGVDNSNIAMAGPICTGPYAFAEFNPTEFAVVVKNEYYWEKEVPLDKVTLKVINDQSTRSMALQAGEIQVAYNLKTENIAEFEGKDKVTYDSLESLRSTYAFMNQNGVLKDRALRQAFIRALDKETYTSVVLKGGATAGKAPIPPTLDFGFDELIDENAYDPESAKQILADAGYKDIDGDGYVESPTGEKIELKFVIYTSREELGIYGQAAQMSLKDVGINVKLNVVSYETLLDMRDSGSYDLLIWNVLVGNTGDCENYLRENWYSSSPSNTAGYNNAEVDRLLEELGVTFDEEGRKELAIEIQQHIMDDAAAVFFGYETTYLFYSTDMKGVEMYPMDYYWLTADMDYVK